MSFRYFDLVSYALVALAGVASLAAIGHRFRQRSLHKIPGPPNASRFWGRWLENSGHVLKAEGNEQVIGVICTTLTPIRSMKDYTPHMEQ
jgi:hypothetical protein